VRQYIWVMINEIKRTIRNINARRCFIDGICKKIKEIRLNSFLNQEEFANKLGVSFATVNRWETGKTLPNIKAMKKIDEYCKAEKIECNIRDYIGNAYCEKQ